METYMRNVLIALAIVASGCATTASQDPEAVRREIERQNASAVQYYASGALDSLVKIFAEDAWQLMPNHEPLVGREAIKQYWARAIRWGKWEFTLQTQQLTVSGPVAVERGKYALRFTAHPGAPAGIVSSQDQGNYLTHWRLDRDGSWRIAVDAALSEIPR